MKNNIDSRIFPISIFTAIFLTILIFFEIYILFGGLEFKNDLIDKKLEKLIPIIVPNNSSSEKKINDADINIEPIIEDRASNTNKLDKIQLIYDQPVG